MAHICFQAPSVACAELFYLQSYLRSEVTALRSNKYSGWTTITHPFHPLRGKRFKVLAFKNFNNCDILSLQLSDQNQDVGRGVVAVLRDWTDKADLNPYQNTEDVAPILSCFHLYQLSELVDTLSQTTGVDT
jgi:hypothetical protein